jgi:hypothetical protein
MPVILQEHPAIIKPDSTDVIYRYLDFEKFEKLLSDNALFFCRSDRFSDPFEASTLKREVEYRVVRNKKAANFYGRTISDEDAQKSSNDMAALHKKLRKSFIVNCWHINNKGESDAMWRLYLKTNEGVAIQSTVGSLIDSLTISTEDIYISNVRYLDYINDIYYHSTEYPCTSYNLISPIVHKRNAFSHESELRLFYQIREAEDDETYWDKSSNPMGRNIKCNIVKLVQRLILPPTSDNGLVVKIEALLSKYNLTFNIEKSKLTEEPFY